jgi:hypothetical protein
MYERITISMPGDLAKRIRRLAKLEHNGSFSAAVAKLCVSAIADAELSSDAMRDPLTQRLVAEMLRPEALERAARIVGESADDPQLFKQRADALIRRIQTARVKS